LIKVGQHSLYLLSWVQQDGKTPAAGSLLMPMMLYMVRLTRMMTLLLHPARHLAQYWAVVLFLVYSGETPLTRLMRLRSM
jgi:hypothetical protein